MVFGSKPNSLQTICNTKYCTQFIQMESYYTPLVTNFAKSTKRRAFLRTRKELQYQEKHQAV